MWTCRPSSGPCPPAATTAGTSWSRTPSSPRNPPGKGPWPTSGPAPSTSAPSSPAPGRASRTEPLDLVAVAVLVLVALQEPVQRLDEAADGVGASGHAPVGGEQEAVVPPGLQHRVAGQWDEVPDVVGHDRRRPQPRPEAAVLRVSAAERRPSSWSSSWSSCSMLTAMPGSISDRARRNSVQKATSWPRPTATKSQEEFSGQRLRV